MTTVKLPGPCWAMWVNAGAQEPAHSPTVRNGKLHWYCDSGMGGSHAEHTQPVTRAAIERDEYGQRYLTCWLGGETEIRFYEVASMRGILLDRIAGTYHPLGECEATQEAVAAAINGVCKPWRN